MENSIESIIIHVASLCIHNVFIASCVPASKFTFLCQILLAAFRDIADNDSQKEVKLLPLGPVYRS